MPPKCRLRPGTLSSHRKNAQRDHYYERVECLAAQGHTRAPMGMLKGRPSAQEATSSEQTRSQSTSSTRRPSGPPPARYTHALLSGASNAPRHVRSRALRPQHALWPTCASPENRTLPGHEPSLSTRTHLPSGGALSETNQVQKYYH